MESLRDISDETVTPLGRVFLQKQMLQAGHCAIGMKYPIDDIEAMKVAVKNSIMAKHPHFCSIMVRNSSGVEQWRRTEIDINRHFIVIESPVGDSIDDEAAVNKYIAELSVPSSFHFDETKPLWDIHVLKAHKCVIVRTHHALGDGTSIMSMILTLCRRVDDPDSLPTIASSSSRKPEKASLFLRVWFSIIYIVGFLLRSVSLVWDRKNPITGGDGVELWPRKLASARFMVDDMKFVKRAIPGATINDVLTGVIWAGLCRYIDKKRPGSMRFGREMTGVTMVNQRKKPGLIDLVKLTNGDPDIEWGNRFGIMLLPVYYQTKTNPLDYVVEAKAMMSRKRGTIEAAFSYWIGNFVTEWFGEKFMSGFLRRIICGTTFSISNMVGPREPIMFVGNPITYVRASIMSLPHSLTMHMVSYGDRADLQILVAKDIIPDPEFLATCFDGALMDMKAMVASTCGRYKGE